MTALLNADPDVARRQIHGVTAEETFVFSGEECPSWCGHIEGESYTIAGNTLAGEEVLLAVAAEFETGDPSEPLSKRLIESLRAGYVEGGDRRYEREIQSAAVRVWTEGQGPFPAFHNDLRTDATRTPMEELMETYERAQQGSAE